MNSDLGVLLDQYKEDLTIRAKSVLSTAFGDIVQPFGGSIWLEHLSCMVAPLGINDRLVRTGLYRLSEEGWTVGSRKGRKSFYRLTPSAVAQTEEAEKSIYRNSAVGWDGNWLFVFLVITPVDVEARAQLEQELSWMGFGVISRHVWAHPQGSIKRLEEKIVALGLDSQVVCMKAQNILDTQHGLSLDDVKLAQMCSPTDQAEQKYAEFIERFSPLSGRVSQLVADAAPEEVLALRLLVVDQFRRAVLQDPHLPEALLPGGWPGGEARKLCGKIYADLLKASDAYYVQMCSANGSPQADELNLLEVSSVDYSGRFSQ